MTICVPTYNRAAYLRQLLESIARYAPGFRILVSDNASTDGTARVIREFSEKYGCISYHRHAVNRGAVVNLLEAVRLAGSDWVMLMGDDDAIHTPLDIVPKVLASTAADAILLGRCDGDENLAFLRTWPYLATASLAAEEGPRIFSEPEFLFASGLCLGAAFSFISGILVRRNAWLESLDQLERGSAARCFAASLYPQSWIILNLMSRGSSVCVIDQPFIMARHGNDRLCHNNVLEHARIDIEEFDAIGRHIASSRPAFLPAMQELIRRHLRRHVFPRFGAGIYQRGKYGDKSWRGFRIAASRYLSPCQKWGISLLPARFVEFAYSAYCKYMSKGQRNPNQVAQ